MANSRYTLITQKDTDQPLPSDVRLQNNTRYMYFSTLAKGGKCLIQTCKDLHLNRTVAYKSLHAEIANDPTEQQRFLREARVTAMLQHPNTVPLYEIGRDQNGHYYFTMKRVEGITLRDIIDGLQNGNRLIQAEWKLEQLIDLLIQVCQALDYAHTHGVIHRDIKPANIVAGSFGEVVLLDWGLAKVADTPPEKPRFATKIEFDETADPRLTAQGELQATPLYMSPEQVAESPDLDQRSDVYSMGAVLFEILTLKHLAWGDSIQQIMWNTQHSLPPTPSVVAEDREVPALLESICLRSIAKDPDHRIASISLLLRELIYWHRLQVQTKPIG